MTVRWATWIFDPVPEDKGFRAIVDHCREQYDADTSSDEG